jgi:transcription initiation factor IIE alpha subunit
MKPNPDDHTIRRIVLPSGRSIEVVRFFLDEVTTRGLHICPECDSRLVQPTAWTEAPQGVWELTLKCPNCDWSDDGVFDQDQVDALEETLDTGLTEMLSDLRRLTQSNMNEEIERFAKALHGDLILPEDF